MRAIFRVLKKAWSVAKEDRQLRCAAIILWVFYLLNYVVLMVQPLLQSSLLDGVELIIRGGDGVFMMLVGVVGMLVSGIFLAIYQAKTRPICNAASSELKIRILQRIYSKLCHICYSTFDSPSLYEKTELVSGRYPGFCADLLFGRTLSSLVGTAISFVFTSIVLCRVDPLIAVIIEMFDNPQNCQSNCRLTSPI